MSDLAALLRDRVAEAYHGGTALYICGGDSKRNLLGRDTAGATLNIADHTGIVDYQPAELVMTCRAGTPVSDICRVLAAEGQQLPFEPPTFGGRATIGGTLACNLSGPARPWQGSARDATLGIQLITGRGEQLCFGGQVVKNVAGYDVSRLQAGAMGTLGLISEISLRVIPKPELSLTVQQPMDAGGALDVMCRRAAEPGPLTGAAWIDGHLYLRLAGAASAVRHSATLWGGDLCSDADSPWEALREMRLPFFAGDAPLWRQSTLANEPLPAAAHCLIDWGGAQRWWREQPMPQGRDDGLLLFAGGNRQGEVRPPVGAAGQRLQQRLKQVFDPAGILNPGRLYSWM